MTLMFDRSASILEGEGGSAVLPEKHRSDDCEADAIPGVHG